MAEFCEAYTSGLPIRSAAHIWPADYHWCRRGPHEGESHTCFCGMVWEKAADDPTPAPNRMILDWRLRAEGFIPEQDAPHAWELADGNVSTRSPDS